VAHAGRILGVLDLDSPRPGRFTEEDARGLEEVVRAFTEATDLD
jgi:GAF domain-containing protein